MWKSSQVFFKVLSLKAQVVKKLSLQNGISPNNFETQILI